MRPPRLLEREREIHADGGLPHTALAAAHRDDVPDSWQLFRTGGRLLGRRVWRVVMVVVGTGGLHASSFLSFWPEISPSAKGPPLCVYVLSTAKNVPSILNKAIRVPWTSTSRRLTGLDFVCLRYLHNVSQGSTAREGALLRES